VKKKEQAMETTKKRYGGGREAYTLQEFGQALGVSWFSVWRQVKSNDVRSVRFGRRILIPKEELDRVLGR
jgi:excisionase family DNA binding protein